MEWLKKNSKNIGLLLLTIFILLLFLEIGFRIHYLYSTKNNIEKAFNNPEIPYPGSKVFLGSIIRPSVHRKIIYELKSNLNVSYMDSSVQTNSLGWREKEFSEKENNTIRIIGVGDSVMFGWGVEEYERYMDILEKKLNKEYPEKKWETYVFAVPGYQLFMELEIIKKYGINYDPDLIIYGYVSNDVCLPNFIRQQRSFFSKELFTISYLKNSLDNSTDLYRSIDGLCSPEKVPSEYKNYVGEEAFLKQLKELEKIDITSIVLFHHNFPDNLKPEGLYYFDAELNYHNLSLVLRKEDPHPSVKGHEVIANELFDQMVENKIIDSLLKK
jgi:hypothetical protein